MLKNFMPCKDDKCVVGIDVSRILRALPYAENTQLNCRKASEMNQSGNKI